MLTNQSTSTTGTIPKEKTSKSAKQQQPRKPPPTVDTFWPSIMQEVQSIAMVDAKHQALPLARIKKIMKLDENAKMIAAEAPLLFAKACEFFIQELTMRAWIHTDESKRRTLQRSDIAQAIANYDQFDFLIDIVPREDIKPSSHRKHHNNDTNSAGNASVNSLTNTTSGATNASGQDIMNAAVSTEAVTSIPQMSNQQPATSVSSAASTNTQPAAAQVLTTSHPTQQLQIIQQTAQPQQHMQYFITLPGQQPGQAQLQLHQLQLQQQQQLPNTIATPLAATSLNLVAQQPQQLILTAANPSGQSTNMAQQQQQAAILQNLVQQQQQQQQTVQQQPQVQLLQQVVVTPTGEIANMPIAINANQLNLLRLQMQQQQQQPQQHHQPAQQTTHQSTQQQLIIPTNCQLLTAQQLLQLQQTHANSTGGTGATAHIVHHQQQTQPHHTSQPATNTIYINASNATATPSNVQTGTASLVPTDRNLANTFRNNC